jgi:hypothetical protein
MIIGKTLSGAVDTVDDVDGYLPGGKYKFRFYKNRKAMYDKNR